MYDIILVKTLKTMPVFSLSDVAKITKSRGYSKKLLRRLIASGLIKKIMRDKYTLHDDLSAIAPFLAPPAYISCASALSYYGLIAQIPNAIFLMTPKRPKIIDGETRIIYHHTRHYFGFEEVMLNGLRVPFAEPEKAVIDSIGIHPLHIIAEALNDLSHEKLIDYAEKSGEMKRIGYLLDRSGFPVKAPKNLSYRYIYLDPLGQKKGTRDKKWRLIVNF
jgi:predicted transcriptional regulator of viral defense system